MPPSFTVLEDRLRGRSRDPEPAILRRLATAREEITAYPEYDHVVVNDELESCVDQVRAIVIAGDRGAIACGQKPKRSHRLDIAAQFASRQVAECQFASSQVRKIPRSQVQGFTLCR